MTSIRFLTLNTWNDQGPWKDRWNIILHDIQKLQPHMVWFQEMLDIPWAKKVVQLAGYPYSAIPNEPFGLMIMSQFPIAEWDCMKLRTQSQQQDWPRGFLLARLRVHQSILGILNTHLSWRLEEGATRENQIQKFISFSDY